MKGVLKKIEEEILYCRKCNLWRERKNPVVGGGSWEAKIMFVGEAPGANEDEKGIPFCGAAGKILDELLNTIGIKREEIYITNILKCRPPQNRNPKEEEIIACTPYLDRQIEIIKPMVICCLGNFATFYIMKKFGLENKVQKINKIHGMVFTSPFDSVKIIPLYHPAVVTYNIRMRPLLQKDIKVVRLFLNGYHN